MILLTAIVPASHGDVGDSVGNPVFPEAPTSENFFSVGVAFVGNNADATRNGLYVNRNGDSRIWLISPIDGSLSALRPVFDTGIPQWPAAISYDPSRNGLWIGTQKSVEGPGFGNCGDPDVVNTDMPIYFWDFNDDSVEMVFTIPSTQPVEGGSLFGRCRVDGLAYDIARDEIWVSDMINRNVGVFRPDGGFLRGYNAMMVDSSLANGTGIAVASDVLYLANDGLGDVFRAGYSQDALVGIDADLSTPGVLDPFVNGTLWLADMACDAFTFAPLEVMWVRTSPQGIPGNDRITAYEIEPGGCGAGPPLGACCDPSAAPCRDVPQSQCQGATEMWTGGTLCAGLDPPCHDMRRIILLDRTGSMQALFDENTTRCERARQTAIADVMSFFAQNPTSSSVAVWTFHGTGPTDLAGGFVDEATAIAALESLAGVNCTDWTPLARSLCDAVNALLAAFPSALASTLEISVSTDGEENNSDGPCAGDRQLYPPYGSSPGGNSCVLKDEDDELFAEGSWQRNVCDHTIGNAVVLARFWGDLSLARKAKQNDVETGAALGSGVPDDVFFQALAEATGGTFTFIDDFPPEPSGPPAFGVTGACCLPDGTCQESITEAECAVLNGTHQGEATVCADAAGACCLPDGVCQDATTQSACSGQGATFQGTCTACAAHVVGACCLPNETCQDGMTPSDCAVQNGVHRGGCTVCTGEPDECPAPIPAISEWGLVVLGLLSLVAGTIVLGQRERMGVR